MLDSFIKVENVICRFTKAICYISFIGILAIMLLNVADVLMAKTFRPILGSFEVTQRLLMCTVFASFAYTQATKKHITMTIIIARYPRALRFTFFTIASLLSVFVAGALSYAGYYQAGVSRDMGTITDVLFIPLYPFFYVQSIAMAAFAIALLFDSLMSFFAIFKKDFAQHIMADWSDS